MTKLQCHALIVAAGKSERMGTEQNKVFLPLCGKPVLQHTIAAFERCDIVDSITVVGSPHEFDEIRRIAKGFSKLECIVPGGETRQQSVYNGLCALAKGGDSIVLVQDGARPLSSDALIRACHQSVLQHGSGVAASPVHDTIKQVDQGVTTIDRSKLRAVQTPQAFYLNELLDGYEKAFEDGAFVTDDASILERLGKPIHLVEMQENNLKITTPMDLIIAEAFMQKNMPATGFGYDVHALVEGRPLVLCGVTIPYEKGLLGHSDADVATHALIDAILGAACLGDIGRLYPDSDMRYKGISSMKLLKDTLSRLDGRTLLHVDITIIAQRPKLAPFMQPMLESLQNAMPGTRVSIKATTTEGLGFTGRGEGIAAQAVATLC